MTSAPLVLSNEVNPVEPLTVFKVPDPSVVRKPATWFPSFPVLSVLPSVGFVRDVASPSFCQKSIPH